MVKDLPRNRLARSVAYGNAKAIVARPDQNEFLIGSDGTAGTASRERGVGVHPNILGGRYPA